MNNAKNIILKAFKILINPKKEWANLTDYCEIDLVDLKEIQKFMPIYLLIPIFAILPALAHFLGMTIFKDVYFPSEMLKYAQNEQNQQLIIYLQKLKEVIDNGDIGKILAISLVHYIAEIFRPFIYAILVFFLSPAFGGSRNPYRALVVAVISLIPFWIASLTLVYNSVFTAILIFLATFYSLYITYHSADRFLCIPNENSKPFQFIIVFSILYLVLDSVFGMFIENLFVAKLILHAYWGFNYG